MVLQINGEYALDGSIQNPLEKVSIKYQKRVLLFCYHIQLVATEERLLMQNHLQHILHQSEELSRWKELFNHAKGSLSVHGST